MKGIILAGGRGTRLFPMTEAVSKQMLPVYNKPMIYYPLTTMMLAGIREILIITTPADRESYERLLGSGNQFGVNFHYGLQSEPRGLAEAFIIGREFVGPLPVALMLGDNLFHGHDLGKQVQSAAADVLNGGDAGGVIFGYAVKDPERYGVVELDAHGIPVGIEEKPKAPKSRLAVPGIYFYGNSVMDMAMTLRPSARGELEITDINRIYLMAKRLKVRLLGRGTAWLDAGTPESLLQASNFVQTVEDRQGLMIGCPEEVAYRMGFITGTALDRSIAKYGLSNPYGAYLKTLLS